VTAISFATFRFTIVANFVAYSTGRSAGFAPRMMTVTRPLNPAARSLSTKILWPTLGIDADQPL
jgi:hypothetical protein